MVNAEGHNELNYDGDGELSHLHATIYRGSHGDGWRTEVLEETGGGKAVAYVYGETMPLTNKMAHEIASRFVTGRKIPKRLEWR